MNLRKCVGIALLLLFSGGFVMTGAEGESGKALQATVRQLTAGPRHHFFGYIGHALTIPWSADGRYIVALETNAFERMPVAGEAASVVVLDTMDSNKVVLLDKTCAWNPQQGTMFYWNPEKPETQFFFNDLDPKTGTVFTALYDVQERRRVKEYRFAGHSIANGGVNPRGGSFAGINYGRISRMRKVISYAGATDWTKANTSANPEDDGLFLVDIASGACKLLVSHRKLAEFLNLASAETYPVYVHHTLWNRDGDRIFFIVRGTQKLGGVQFHPNAGLVINTDGSGLRMVPFNGHPEWGAGKRLMLPGKDGFELYDVDSGKVTGVIGSKAVFPNTWEDNAFSPDAALQAGSHNPDKESCVYTILRLADGAFCRSPALKTQRRPKDEDCRVDPAPCWNRYSDALLVPGIADDGSRQIFEVKITIAGSR